MASPTGSAPRPFTCFVLIALLCAVWGSTWLVIADGLAHLPPFTSAAARFGAAAVAMTAVARFLGSKEGGGAPTFALSLAVGALNFAATYALVYWTERRLPSGIVAVLWAVYPIFMAASAHFFLDGEKLAPRRALGFVVAFAGVVLLFAKDLPRFGSDAVPSGLLLLASPLAACVGTTLLKKHGAGTSSLALNRNAMWIGAALLGVLALTLERDAPVEWTSGAIGSVVYLALAGTVLTFALYFWLLRHIAASKLSVISYVTPAIALVLGTTVRGEPIGAWTIAGSLTILGGVVLVVLR